MGSIIVPRFTKFVLDVPNLNLALNIVPFEISKGVLNHLGFQVNGADEVQAFGERLEKAGLKPVWGKSVAEQHKALADADKWLRRLGLAGFEHRFPRHLSGGQRKRVALAQVLAVMPKLLLMDEPFASLDAIVRARTIQDVATLVDEERISVLLVTHDLEEAIGLSDRIFLLSQGPRAHVTHEYAVPLPRPRDPVCARMHPGFTPLYEKLWTDLSHEVDARAEAAE